MSEETKGTALDPNTKFAAPAAFIEQAHVKTMDEYKKMYEESINDPEAFWGKIAETFTWFKKWDKVVEYNFDLNKGDVFIRWFIGGTTNITVNALDRHLETRGEKTAIIWEGNEPGEERRLTYREMYTEVNKFANVLKSKGVKKGDPVSIYMPMIPELAVAVLACARIGAIHSVVFGGFSAESLADRIIDSSCKYLVTVDGGFRGKKPIPLKAIADDALALCSKQGHEVKSCVVYNRINADVEMKAGRDEWWSDLMKTAADYCEPEQMGADDPLFILYTSGSTGKPKGVMHTVGGYMVYTALTQKLIFDYQENDIYWCTADIGWVTGHSYIVYGPLANGATSVMFEGIPNYPDPGRFWAVVDKLGVNQFYTAPTAIRALMREGDQWVNKYSLKSLKLLGSVGEPINPEAWNWYYNVVGKANCPIVDTWWQTETGGILITPLPAAIAQKPGSATLPFFGVNPMLMDDKGNILEGPAEGALVIDRPWPAMMRTVYGDHKRFEDTYFSMYKGYYFTGDGARRDEDGYYWITGRIDDVINVSGHRMGTAEVESALVAHPFVSEAAVVGYPHEIKGQGIYAYVTLKAGQAKSDALSKELKNHVRNVIGAIAAPDVIHWADGLPKTRSGKIMRRILRKIAAGETENLGDITTLADPSVVQVLVDTMPKN